MADLVFIPNEGAGGGGSGDVVGPAGATPNAIVLFDGATGKLIKESVLLVDGAGNITTNGAPVSIGSSDPGDDTTVVTGDNGAGNAGDVIINPGDGSVDGGSVNIVGGDGGTGNGGNVNLQPGQGGAADGEICFISAGGAAMVCWIVDPTTVDYTLKLPLAQGAADTWLKNDGAGNLEWATIQAGDITPAFEIASYTKTAPDGAQTLYERGDILVGTAIAATYVSGPPDTGTINNTLGGSVGAGDVNPAAWTFVAPFAAGTQPANVRRDGVDGGADPTWAFQLDVDKGAVNDTSTITATWTRRLYWGQSASGTEATQAAIQALTDATNVLDQNRVRSFTLTCANTYVYFALPDDYGTPTFTVNGFSGGFSETTSLVTFNTLNAAALPSNYNIWRSDNLLTGTILFEVT